MRVNVIGLGKLGLPLAALYAKAGHVVNGVDQNAQLISSLNEASFESPEPGLLPLLDQIRSGPWNLTFTTGYREVTEQDYTFIVVPTPSNTDGSYDLRFIDEVIINLANQFRQHSRYHQFIIVSTVNPGDTEQHIRPMFEKISGKDYLQIGFVYSPEFIALGSVIEGMKDPDFVLVGADRTRDHDRYVNLASTVAQEAPFCGTTPVNAELAKIALNSYVTMKISYANMIADICEKVPGGNADAVLQVVGSDHRVGHAYLKPGGPFSGPCFPRDNRALANFATKVGTIAQLPHAVDEINEYTHSRIYARISELVESPKLGHILIVGKSYKPNTTVTDEALGPALYELSYNFSGCQVEIWDPEDGTPVPFTGPDTLMVLATPGLSAWKEAIYEDVGCILDVWGELPYNSNVVKLGRGSGRWA